MTPSIKNNRSPSQHIMVRPEEREAGPNNNHATTINKTDDRNDDDDDDDDDASSLSSTPLIVLKQRKMQEKINPSTKATAAKTKSTTKAIKKASTETTRNRQKKGDDTKTPSSSKSKKTGQDNDDDPKQLAKTKTQQGVTIKKRPYNKKKDKLGNKATHTTPKTSNTKRETSNVETTKMNEKLDASPTTLTKVKKTDEQSPRKYVPKKGSSIQSQFGENVKSIENKEVGITNNNSDDDDDDDDESMEEEAACCLCHCGVDCSDRALFFPKDRKQELEEDEDYYFTMDDPYLDKSLYDRNNALVYCDTCGRLYHQKCHFVPLLVIPRGDWNCLICTIQQQQQQGKHPTSSSKRKRKQSHGGQTTTVDPSAAFHNTPSWQMFLNRKVTDQLFQSPPRVIDSEFSTAITSSVSKKNTTPAPTKSLAEVLALQKEWELASGAAKSFCWYQQIRQLKTFLNSQASNIRMANAALSTLTSTKRNRQHFSNRAAKSQELAQTIVRLTAARFKIRDALVSLEGIRTRDESVNFSCLIPWCEEHPQHSAHVFPHGNKLWQERRIVPRTGERKGAVEEIMETNKYAVGNSLNDAAKGRNGSIPTEIKLQSPPSSPGRKNSTSASRKNGTALSTKSKGMAGNSKLKQKGRDNKMTCRVATNKQKNDNDDDDNDSGITLDDLKCSVCLIGDCTDDNDVILCDGQGCHRAFHMKCVYPAVKLKDIENEDEDWFCPICLGLSKVMGEMHDLCVSSEGVDDDDDDDDDNDDGDDGSEESWENVQDVFPESEWEYETAMKLSKGKRNEDTQRLLAIILGEDIAEKTPQMPIGSDSEDENDYSLFDEESFEQKKKKMRQEKDGDNDDTTCSSDVTLVDLSSVEYKVGKAELAALSEDEDDSDDDSDEQSDSDKETGKIRKSRRISKRTQLEEGESRSIEIGADFSESNILEGKRKRKRVDYRKLNDALFGKLTRKEQGLIDDADDFVAEDKKQTADDAESEEGSGSEQGGDDDDDDDDEDDDDDDDDSTSSSREEDDDESNEDTSTSSGDDDDKS